MSTKHGQVIKLIRTALPHDFFATLLYIGTRIEDVEKAHIQFSQYYPTVKWHKRVSNLENLVQLIDDAFLIFWNEHGASTNFNHMELNFGEKVIPLFETLENETDALIRIINSQHRPHLFRNNQRAEIARIETINALQRASYFSKRGQYYISGMRQLVDFNLSQQTQETNLNKLVKIQEELLENTLNGKIRLKIPEKLPTIAMDYSHAFVLFSNLFKNSIKYRKSRDCNISIVYDTGNNLKSYQKNALPKEFIPFVSEVTNFSAIHFIDDGIGIKEDSIADIKNPFIRGVDEDEESDLISHLDFGDGSKTNDSRELKYSGLGIGLAVIDRVVDLYGGHLYPNSKHGVGSCFTIKIPRGLVLHD